MDIKLSNILSVPAKVYETEIQLDYKFMTFKGMDYQVAYMTPVHIKLTNMGNQKLHIEADFTIHLNIPCDRCLDDVLHKYEICVDRKIDVSERADNQDLDDVSFISEYNLDVDMLVYEEVFVRLPMKNLCNEDCKGICSVCGTNLNRGECGCDRRIPDPRMSDILDIFNSFKEV